MAPQDLEARVQRLEDTGAIYREQATEAMRRIEKKVDELDAKYDADRKSNKTAFYSLIAAIMSPLIAGTFAVVALVVK